MLMENQLRMILVFLSSCTYVIQSWKNKPMGLEKQSRSCIYVFFWCNILCKVYFEKHVVGKGG